MSKKSWYKRSHQFTPYTKADGQAVSDEFDSIQASFERIPEMRDDGAGFAVSPIIPNPTKPNHPVTLEMLTATEKSVNNARDDVTIKAQQVEQNARTVATNTQTAINQANSASQSAASALSSQQSSNNSEDMARKWASNPEDQIVSGDKYSAYHYAMKAGKSAHNLSIAEQSARNNAAIATQKAEEAKTAAKKAESLAGGEVEYEKILNVPRADTSTYGIVRLTSDTGLDSENLGLTAKAGKFLAQGIAALRLALNNYIPLTSRSSSVTSNDENGVATPKAVKTAYDKGVEAKNTADAANLNANNRVPKTGDTTINGTLRAKNTSGGWSAYQFETSQGYWQLEVHPNSHEAANRRFNMIFNPNTGDRVYLSFPALGNNGEAVAYQSFAVNKSGDTMTGILRTPGIASSQFGFGSYAQQYTSGAPFMVEETNANQKDTYYPMVKGRFRKQGQYGTAVSFGYTTKQGNGDGFGTGITINLIEDNGAVKNWLFQHSGDFVSAGDVKSSSGKSLNATVQLSDFRYQKIGDFEIHRYPDGMMIQIYTVDVMNIVVGRGTEFNWSVSFADIPFVSCSLSAFKSSVSLPRGQLRVNQNDYFSSGSKFSFSVDDIFSGGKDGLRIKFVGIGRWK